MKVQRVFTMIIAVAVVGLVASACAAPVPAMPATPAQALPPLKIGVGSWVGFGPAYIAEAKGFFKQEGVDVEIVKFDTYDQATSDFASKKTDGSLMVLSDAVNQSAAGIPLQVVWALDSSNGADVVVGSSAISRPTDLAGKRIGLSYGTFGHIFVLTALSKYGLEPGDVDIVNLPAEAIPGALADDQIDAGHTWDPFLSQAVADGAHPLFDSSEIPGLIADLLVFQEKVIEQRPDDIAAIVRAIALGRKFWQENPEEGNAIVAAAMGETPENIPAYLVGLKVYTLDDNMAAFNRETSGSESLYESLQLSVDLASQIGIIDTKPDIESLVNPTFVQQASEQGR
jgi:NitT/TauT family transport system substrate-binding protein